MSRSSTNSASQRHRAAQPPSPVEAHDSAKTLVWAISASAIVLALLHLYAGLNPSASNWGVHHLGFFPPVWGIITSMLMAVLVIPACQSFCVRGLTGLTDAYGALPRAWRGTLILLIVLITGCLFWFARERVFFLGDGYLGIRNLDLLTNSDEMVNSFKVEPLAGFLVWNLSKAISLLGFGRNGAMAFHLLSIASGCLSLFVLAGFARRLASNTVERVLIFFFIALSGGSQLFFGYVETYAPAYFGILLVTWLGCLSIDGRIPLIVPSIVFGVVITLYFGLVAAAPAVVLLWYHGIRKRQYVSTALAVLAAPAACFLVLWLIGYSGDTLRDVIYGGHSHFLPLMSVPDKFQPYTLFSPGHFIDFANLSLLLAPFGLVLLAIALFSSPNHALRKDERSVFLLLLALGGIAFSFFLNGELGMSRDWDLFAPCYLGILLAAAMLWQHIPAPQLTRWKLMIVMAGVTVLHTLPWIALNASEEHGIARFEVLQDERLWGTQALLDAREESAIFYRDRGDALKAISQLRKYLDTDSSNGRLWESLALIYRDRADLGNAVRCHQNAINRNYADEGVYSDLGVCLVRLKRYGEAINPLKSALVLNPGSPLISNDIGLCLLRSDSIPEALRYFSYAVSIDSTYWRGYLNEGYCYRALGQITDMMRAWEKYLALQSNGEESAVIRKILESVR